VDDELKRIRKEAVVTMEHKQSKPLLSKALLTRLNNNKFKMIEAMGLKIIATRSP
jgi:hypothetical protein